MKKIILWSLLIATTFTLSFCKKYEEGPAISLIPKKQRMANTWKYDKIIKNGNQQHLSSIDRNITLTLESNGDAEGQYSDGGFSYKAPGTWIFDENKDKVTISLKHPWHTDTKTYDIIRLKRSELWLVYIDSSNDKWEYHWIPAE
ncbi:MAG: lipocalin family protein [Cytophagaceae bacterium]